MINVYDDFKITDFHLVMSPDCGCPSDDAELCIAVRYNCQLHEVEFGCGCPCHGDEDDADEES